MTIGVIYLVMSKSLLDKHMRSYIAYLFISAMFSIFIVAIMHTINKGERKQTHCFALDILSDDLCMSRSVHPSFSFALACLLVCACFLTSILWLSLQDKQRKFAQH
jgi:hypothetical protein